jgi:predicted MFS family arabinose efflux permease
MRAIDAALPGSSSPRLRSVLPVRNPWRGLRALPRDAWIIAATSLVNRAGVMALPFLVLYLTRYLHVPATLAGLSLSVYGVGGILTAPLAGRLSDRVGPLVVLRASLALTGVLLFILPLAHNFAVILGLTFLWAVVADGARPATMSALTTTTSPDQRKAAIALNRLAVNLGMSIGPAVGGFLAVVSFPLLFIVDGATSLAAALLLSILLRSRKLPTNIPARATPLETGRLHATRTSVWRDRNAVEFLIAMFLVNLVFMQNQGALPLYVVRDLHHRESFYGMMFVVNTLIIVAIEVPLNLAMSHWRHRPALTLGILLTATGFGALAFGSSTSFVIATVVIWTFGEMILFPVSTAYVADIAPPGRNGEYMGAFSSVISLALVVGPWLGVAALDRFGPVAMWSGVLVVGLAAAGALLLSKDHPPMATE